MSRIVTSLAAASLAALAAVPAAVPAAAQQAAPAAAKPAPSAVAALAGSYRSVNRYLLAAAEQLPDSAYAYRPNAQVRTAGELIGHIAYVHNLGCAAALGEPAPSDENFEKTRTTKAALVEALRSSAAVCDRAFAQSDADALGMTKLFGERSRISALALVAGHDWEHYGNLVTYIRLLGMVPPSSQ